MHQFCQLSNRDRFELYVSRCHGLCKIWKGAVRSAGISKAGGHTVDREKKGSLDALPVLTVCAGSAASC